MTLKLSEFWKMEKYRAALDTLLSWDEADETDKGEDIGAVE
jgi:ribonuclease Z